MTTRRLSAWRPVLSWMGVAGITAAAHVLGRRRLAPPPWTHPSGLVAWWDGAGTLDATFALLRVTVVACGAYILGLGTVALAWRLTRWASLVRLLTWISLPGLRLLVLASVGVTGIGTSATTWAAAVPTATTAAANPPPPAGNDPPTLGPLPSAASPTSNPTSPGPVTAGPGDASPVLSLLPAAPPSTPTPTPTTAPPGDPLQHAAAGPPTMYRLADPTPPATAVAPGLPRPGEPPKVGDGATPEKPRAAVGGEGHGAGSSPPPSVYRRLGPPTPPALPPKQSSGSTSRTESGMGAPAGTTPAPHPSGPRSYTVRSGDSLWSIADATLTSESGHPPAQQVLARYWWEVVELNRPTLPDPTNPDLLFPGDTVWLPPLPPDAAAN